MSGLLCICREVVGKKLRTGRDLVAVTVFLRPVGDAPKLKNQRYRVRTWWLTVGGVDEGASPWFGATVAALCR